MAVDVTKELLLSVRKPARYIGGEIGSVRKDLSKVDVKVCLCFPDTYEIGMSHLGMRVLYDVLNKQSDCAAERVFSPWVDMEEKLKESGIPLFSLESKIPVRDFDCLGFSLQYELSYTNVLNILSLSGIPLRSDERGADDPLVIAGGACALNPEPMADFIDLFCVGEAEDCLLEIIAEIKAYKRSGARDRAELLKRLSLLEGVYAPLCRLPVGKKISKRFVMDLDRVLDFKHWVVPFIEIVHDRLTIEIMRGCPNSCRFCQARCSFYPVRIISAEKILETARRLYRLTGYDEISLLSLSSSDHPDLKEIITELSKEFKDKGVSISLPSLRAKIYIGEMSKIFASTRKTSLTFAPEAGTDRLRRIIGKDLSIDELFSVAGESFAAGYRLLKLYFMIGLPTETDEDLDAIVSMARDLSRLKKEINGHPAQLNISISSFIPKPHTHFQRCAMEPMEALVKKQEYLKNLFRKCKGTIHPSYHDVYSSFLEGVFARGDRKLGSVVLKAFQKGARFDSWNNMFNFSIWKEAFLSAGIDPGEYLRARRDDEPLPWDFIDLGSRDKA